MTVSNNRVGAAWLGDWRARVILGLKQLGFQRLTDLARSRETATLPDLVNILGGQLAPVQLAIILREEVRTQEDFDYFIRTLLVRELRELCPNGWKRHREFDLVLVTSGWSGALGESMGAQSLEVFRKLKSRTDLPDDWLPSGVDDPVIQNAFRDVPFVWKHNPPDQPT